MCVVGEGRESLEERDEVLTVVRTSVLNVGIDHERERN